MKMMLSGLLHLTVSELQITLSELQNEKGVAKERSLSALLKKSILALVLNHFFFTNRVLPESYFIKIDYFPNFVSSKSYLFLIVRVPILHQNKIYFTYRYSMVYFKVIPNGIFLNM